MSIKSKNKGFSLVELVICIAVLAVCVSILVPSYLTLSQESKVKADLTKFDSISAALKTALSEPEVQKEMKKIGGEQISVTFRINDGGLIEFVKGQMLGNEERFIEHSKLWVNISQKIGTTYNVENEDFHNKFLVFTLTPKTSTTTAKCEYVVQEYAPQP